MNYLPDAALFLGFVISLVAMGWSLSSRETSSLEAAFVPGAALLGGAGFVIWVVGSLGRLGVWVEALFAVPLLVAAMRARRGDLRFHARRAVLALRDLSGADRGLALYVAALGALTFALSLAPPGGADYDSLTYHLAAPAQFLRAGKVVALPYDHHSYFPFTLEMLYLAGLAARGAVLAKLFHWLMLPLGALALLALGRRAQSARAGLLAAALYASMPLVLGEATTAYVDLGFAAWVFLALLCFEGATAQRSDARWLWCGAFCGFALGSKYFGWLIFGFLGVWLLVAGARAQTLSARRLALFACPALLIGLPWYARNALWTGNPVFPFAFGIFGGRGWTSAMAAAYDASQTIYGFGITPLDAAWLPWRLALTPLGAGQPFWPLSNAPAANGKTGLFEVAGLALSSFPGPAVWALGVPALALRRARGLRVSGALFVFLLLFWFVSSQQIRYLLPALGLLALLGGAFWAQHASQWRLARWVGNAGLVAWLVFAPVWLAMSARPSWGVLSGAQSPAAYLSRALPGYDAMQWATRNTPPNAKFAVYGEPRCFYLDRAYFWADDEHNNLIDYAHLRNGADFARALRSLGATHLLWNADAARNGGVFGPPSALMQTAIARGDLIPLTELRGYRIYALRGSR